MQSQRLHRYVYSARRFSGKYRRLDWLSSDDPVLIRQGLDALVEYFWDGQKHYLLRHGTMAYYPGYASIYGSKNDGVEGVTRLLPLWASYCENGHAAPCVVAELSTHLSFAISNGVNPRHPGYWGDIDHRSTLICEAADVALALWIGRNGFWLTLGKNVQDLVIRWLKQVIGKRTADNNWHLFVTLVDCVVCDLDPGATFQSDDRYARVKSFYIGDGCFKDGPEGAVDLYNAWGFHYTLFWINQIRPFFDPEFIRHSLQEYCDWYQYSFTSKGLLLYGRSLLYRTATPCPLIAATLMPDSPISKDLALSAMMSCWNYFVQNGALKLGRLTQGVFEDNVVWTDPYSGPASGFWGTRSLVLYYYLDKQNHWQDARIVKLPAESSNIDISVPSAGFSIVTDKESKLVTLIVRKNSKNSDEIKLRLQSTRDRLKEAVFAVSFRQANNLLEANLREFHSTLSLYRMRVGREYNREN